MKKQTKLIVTLLTVTAVACNIAEKLISKKIKKNTSINKKDLQSKRKCGDTVIEYANCWINDYEEIPTLEFLDDTTDLKEKIRYAIDHKDPVTGACRIKFTSAAEYNSFMALTMGLSEEQYEMYIFQHIGNKNTNTR